MSLAGLLCHEVTIVRPSTTTDRYGDAVKSATAGRRWTTAARVAQQSRIEDHDGREARVTDWLVYLPAGTDIVATDRLLWGVFVFEVIGVPNRAPDRRTEHHVECDLRLVEG